MTDSEKKYFEAGEKLRAVGASFVVSYLYFWLIDSNHKNWTLAKTNNPETVKNSKDFWPIWIEAIVYKDPGLLGTNKIGLNGHQIINMARELLQYLK